MAFTRHCHLAIPETLTTTTAVTTPVAITNQGSFNTKGVATMAAISMATANISTVANNSTTAAIHLQVMTLALLLNRAAVAQACIQLVHTHETHESDHSAKVDRPFC
jgi:hypothetical protein